MSWKCIFFSLILAYSSSVGQPVSSLRFDPVSSENGLSENTVRKIFQDSRGYIWIATQDGLNRYDGFTFTIFNHQQDKANSISDNFINEIAEDHQEISGSVHETDLMCIGFSAMILSAICLWRIIRTDCMAPMCCVLHKTAWADCGRNRWRWIESPHLDTTASGQNNQKVNVHFEQITVHRGGDSSSLLSNSIFNIAFDKFNTMWIGTDKGISKQTAASWSKKIPFVNLNM